jgi:hypothetical protein
LWNTETVIRHSVITIIVPNHPWKKYGVGAIATLLVASAVLVIFAEEIANVFDDLPECSEDTQFDNEMFDIEEIETIIPLGNFNPPGHTFPTEHMYVKFNETSSMRVYAPGNMKVTYLGSKEYSGEGTEGYTDYDITMQFCDDISMHLMHMQLDSELLSKSSDENKWCRSYETHNSKIKMCQYDTEFWIDAGTLLGTSGNTQHNNLVFDIGVKDNRVTNEFIDKEVNAHFLNSVCPFEYFSDEIRQEMEAKAGGWGDNLENIIEPCGEIMFDIHGTAQGSWVKEGTVRNSDTLYDEHGLGLFYDNIFQDELIISSSSEGGYSYRFQPSDEGLVNRSFSSIIVDGNIYCYETGDYPNDIILIKLIDDEHLKIERKNGPLYCSESGALEFSGDAEMFVRHETTSSYWATSNDNERFFGLALPIILSSIALLIGLGLGFSVYRRMNHDNNDKAEKDPLQAHLFADSESRGNE